MKKLWLLFISTLFVVVTMLVVAGVGLAQSPHQPAADTYTDRNNVNSTHGTDIALVLAASNAAGCVETTYLWYKFAVPSTSSTITTASLHLALLNGFGSGTMDLELRSSTDTSWNESTLAWSNQPALESTVLAIAPSTAPGGTAIFSGSTLAAYLDGRKGQTVTLIVRANCSGSVSTSATRVTVTKEHTSGPAATLDLFGPTAVTLNNFSAHSAAISPALFAILGGLLLLGFVVYVYFRTSARRFNRKQ